MAGHNGIDLPCKSGDPVYAAHDGIITFTGQDGAGGWGVVIRTEELFEYRGELVHFKTVYWHLLPNIPVRAGQRVKIGDTIGFGDTTGMATGSHLHFGLKPVQQGEEGWQWSNIEQNNGFFGSIDPEPFLQIQTAHSIRSSLFILKEMLSRISLLVALFIKNRAL